MSKSSISVLVCASRLWARVMRFFTERNERAIEEWSASLQYRRRYTNPEDAKRYRKTR